MRRILKLAREKEGLQVLFIIFPSAFWLIVFFLAPLLIVLAISFGRRGTYGGVVWELNFENYVRFFDPLYLRIFARSVYIALAMTFFVCCWGIRWLFLSPDARRGCATVCWCC